MLPWSAHDYVALEQRLAKLRTFLAFLRATMQRPRGCATSHLKYTTFLKDKRFYCIPDISTFSVRLPHCQFDFKCSNSTRSLRCFPLHGCLFDCKRSVTERLEGCNPPRPWPVIHVRFIRASATSCFTCLLMYKYTQLTGKVISLLQSLTSPRGTPVLFILVRTHLFTCGAQNKRHDGVGEDECLDKI